MVRPFLQRGGMPRGNMGQFRIRGGGIAKPLFPMGPPFRHFGRVLRGPLGLRRPAGPHERLPPPLLHPLEAEEFPIVRRGLFRRGRGPLGRPPPLMPPYHEDYEDEETSFHEPPPPPLMVHARLSRPPRARGVHPRGRGMPMPLMHSGGHMPPPIPPLGPRPPMMPMRGRGFPMNHPRGLRPLLPRGRGIPFFGRGPPHMMRGGIPPMMHGFPPFRGRGEKFVGRGSFRGTQLNRRGMSSSNPVHSNDLLALERAKMKELAHPWVSDAMRNEIRKKHRLYQKFKRTSNPSDHTEFKEQRNKVNTMLREAKLEYIGAHPDEDVTKILLEASLVRNARRQSKQQEKQSSTDGAANPGDEGTSTSAEENDKITDGGGIDYDEEEDEDNNDLELVSEHLRDVEVTVEGEAEESEAVEAKESEVLEADDLEEPEEQYVLQ